MAGTLLPQSALALATKREDASQARVCTGDEWIPKVGHGKGLSVKNLAKSFLEC
jgi:hypothetical protein